MLFFGSQFPLLNHHKPPHLIGEVRKVVPSFAQFTLRPHLTYKKPGFSWRGPSMNEGEGKKTHAVIFVKRRPYSRYPCFHMFPLGWASWTAMTLQVTMEIKMMWEALPLVDTHSKLEDPFATGCSARFSPPTSEVMWRQARILHSELMGKITEKTVVVCFKPFQNDWNHRLIGTTEDETAALRRIQIQQLHVHQGNLIWANDWFRSWDPEISWLVK